MRRNVVLKGAKFEVEFAVLDDGRIPAEVFLLSQKPQHQARLWALFKLLADAGQIRNDQHFKKLQGDFFEFKNFQIRMPCFFLPGGRVVVTHGFIKKQNAVDKSELVRAATIKTAYERHCAKK